jgi:hypothetical protein
MIIYHRLVKDVIVIDVVCLKMNLPHDQGKSSDRQRRKVCK